MTRATTLQVPVKVNDCTAAIIAGGRDKRLGGLPKGLIEVGGTRLIARVRDVLSAIFPRTILIANDPALYRWLGVETFPDVLRDRGAPGGVHAALAHASAEWTFAVGCDMPFLYPPAIQWIAAHRAHWDAVIVTHNGRYEGLHAFYKTTCFPAFDAALRAGSACFHEVIQDLRVKTIHEKEFREAHQPLRTFWNVNTPDDLKKVLAKSTSEGTD